MMSTLRNYSVIILTLTVTDLALTPRLAASQEMSPAGASLYVIWGHSEAGGHDRMDTAPKVVHGDHIWAITDPKKGEQLPIMKQDPPANTFGSEGPSPHNYFADELITEGKATDVVLVKCSSGTPSDDWRIGIKGAIDVIEGCKAKVRYAIENWGLNLSGGGDLLLRGRSHRRGKGACLPR